MDNTAGNTSAAAGRLSNTATLSAVGGTFSLIGNSAGTSETLGSVTFNDGALAISVTNNGGTGAQLSFTDTGSLRDSTKMTVNFVGAGTGTLGSAGNNPRITFTSVFTGTTTGLLSNTSGSDTTIGWATVNGTEWAGYGANGIVAVAPSLTASTNTTLQTATSTSVTLFNPTATQTLTAGVTSGTLKIAPQNSSLSLELGSSTNLAVSALMLAGTTDFTINRASGSSTVMTGGNGRYIWVTDANTTLTLNNAPIANGQPVTKSGAGTLFLSGSTNLLPFTSNQAVNVIQGTLRGTPAALGGGTSAGGAFTTIFLRGGVVEISGGGTFNRAFNLSGTTNGGGINWDGGSGTTRGDGGFSAIGANASVTLMTTVGGSTAASLVWNAAGFVNNGYALTMGTSKADSRLDFTNNIGLDDGTANNSYFAREIRVADNTGSANDVARLSGVISGSANADLLKTGAGVLELTGTNTYSGNTLIQQGTLIATNGAAIANTSAVVLSNTAGATFQLNNSETIGALSGGGTTGGNVNIQGNTLTVGDQRDSTFGGIISGSGGSLSKQGTGILSLTNTSTYSGSTSVTAGSLFLNGSLTKTSGTSVSANATLAANGTIANGVSIASSGKMAIGSDDAVSTLGSVTVGSMALSGSLEFGATGALTYDRLISTGALAVTGGTIAFKTSGYTVAFNTSFDIVDYGSFTGAPTFDFSGASVQQYGAWDTSAFASTGVISYVPEPSTSLLLGAFGSLALLRRRR
jgi:autotransporter-associated beta strand protein